MVEQVEKLQTYGLDTLSEYALRRRVERWTGSLEHPDSVAARYPVGDEVASSSTLNEITGQWQQMREPYIEGQVADVLGEQSSLAYNVRPLDVTVTDSLTTVADNVSSETEVADALLANANVEALSRSEAFSSLPPDLANAMQFAAEQGVVSGESFVLSNNWDAVISVGFNLFVVAIFVGYLFCLYRYFEDMMALLYSVFRRNVILSDKVVERRRSEIFSGFLGKLFLLGVAFVGVLSLAWVNAGRGAELGIGQDMALYAVPLSIGIFLAIIIAQSIVLSVVGVVTQSLSMVSALIRVRLIYFVLCVVIVAPILLIALLGRGAAYQVWMNMGLVAVAATLLLYAKESVELFISKKVSILHWILYLCAVEILPFTLVWQIATRLR
ncbi:MAG: DUF4271 domain-containing protein [Alistipes sp.]|nr:DUF4271 domain-containing protein [Alistipes sp.]